MGNSDDKRSKLHGMPIGGYVDAAFIRSKIDGAYDASTATHLIRSNRTATVTHAMPVGQDTRGIPLEEDGSEEGTIPNGQLQLLTDRIAHVGYFASDHCQCGAEVFLSPDDTAVKPPRVLYNKSFQIIGCPVCMATLRQT